LVELESDALGAITANDDHRVEAHAARVGDHLIGHVANFAAAAVLKLVLERIASVGGAENGAAARQDAADGLQCQLERALRPDDPVEAVANADDAPAVLQDRRAGRAADYGVESGAIPAPGADANGPYVGHFMPQAN